MNYEEMKTSEETWDRFLDDCFLTIDKEQLDPNDLLTILNSLNPYNTV